MSKERLEKLHKFYVSGILNAEDFIKEVVELERINEVLINQNKRYREVIKKAIDDLENECLWDALVALKELEGED